MNNPINLTPDAWNTIFRALHLLPAYECNPIVADIHRQTQANMSANTGPRPDLAAKGGPETQAEGA